MMSRKTLFRQKSPPSKAGRAAVFYGLCLLFLGTALSACTATVDTRTGQTSSDLTIPGAPGHNAAMQRRWEECLKTASVSYCERRHRLQRGQFPPQRPNRY